VVRGCEHALEALPLWSVVMTDPDLGHGMETAPEPDEGKRPPRSEPFWSWLRVIVTLVVAVGLGAWGFLLRPSTAKPISVSVPKITVLASEPDVTATIDMTLSSNLSQAPPYSLTLTITPADPSQSVKFAVSFSSFPKPASGSGHLRHSHNAYYAVISSTPGLYGAASQTKLFSYTSYQPIGENSHGPQLRVAFPDLIGEQPGSPSAQVCGLAASLRASFTTICTQLGNQSEWVPPLLEAGTTTFSSPHPALGSYQYLAGDDPTLLGGNRWTWSGINGVTMLAASVQAQDNEQNDLFYAGLLLGVAAGAGIACIAEFLRPAWRKGTDGRAAETGSTDLAGAQGSRP